MTLALGLPPSFAADRCQPLGEGDSRRVAGYMGSPVWGKYTLVRQADVTLPADYRAQGGHRVPRGTLVPSYLALVNLQFIDANGNVDPRLADKFERKVEGCYARAAAKLRGPEGGFLAIGLAKNHPEYAVPAVSKIHIQRQWFYRSNSENWESSANCPLILHESLHLLGLVDEYFESAMTTRATGNTDGRDVRHLRYDCRVLGPGNSVMSDQGSAFFAAGLDGLSRFFGRHGRASLLMPAEYRSIVAPGCLDSNSLYYDCIQDSYRTSVAHGGDGCADSRPAACTGVRWLD